MTEQLMQAIYGGGTALIITYLVLRLVESYLKERESAFNVRQESFQKSYDSQNERTAKAFDSLIVMQGQMAVHQQQGAETTLKIAQFATSGLDNLRRSVVENTHDINKQGEDNTNRIVQVLGALPDKIHSLSTPEIERTLSAIREAKNDALKDVFVRLDQLETKIVAVIMLHEKDEPKIVVTNVENVAA